MSLSSPLATRDVDLGTLETIKTAWSSPSNCIKSNWCRIPAAVIIVIGVFVLFIIFCCCAQCLSCCCCRGKRRSKRSFDDSELGPGNDQRLLSNPAPFGSDLPSMPSYDMDELKKPTYAVIGDDGSVTTEDHEKRLRDDFPSPTYDRLGVIHDPAPDAPPKVDMFAAANNFHSPLLNRQVDTSYNPQAFSQVPQYPAVPQNGRISPPRRQQLRQQQPPPIAFDQRSAYSDAPPSFTSLPRPDHDSTSRIAQQIQPKTFNSSRGLFNAGGPFPIIGGGGASASVPSKGPSSGSRPLPKQPAEYGSSRPLPGRPGNASGTSDSYEPTLPNTDWLDDDHVVAPYPVGRSFREGSAEHDGGSASLLSGNHEFDPFRDETHRSRF